ncbi:hypothetical protein ALQ33_03066 [Pseudomonas syringae pv. philadelphi]|uniref:Uncharacterized protein n=1 Tax=Pseudomonas syringae pv. philadelphi TaxID=251706 RepID=A0A3M3ZPB9_9PSED|nr:hypothetical protein [Pseudomonas syringae group genomosp. 3]RMO96547.1 hypothetical protein ALQ33_03066 [Pseudomonas syringae pv. philadelphi]
MTKTEFKKKIQDDIDSVLIDLNYTRDKSRSSFVKNTEACEVRISYEATSAGYPKNIISIDVLVFINLPEVNSIGAKIFSTPPVNPATLWGNIRVFTPANSDTDTSYYFDLSKDYKTQLDRLIKDFKIFDSFALKVNHISALSNEKLSKIPTLRKNFEGGLSWDYKYGYPQYISIIHTLNNEFSDARACAENSSHLTSAEKSSLYEFIDEKSTHANEAS